MNQKYQYESTDSNEERIRKVKRELLHERKQWIDPVLSEERFESFPKQSAAIGDIQKVRLCVVKRGQSYGCNRIYPVNGYADDLCSLANMKTFTSHTLQTAYVLGFLVIEEMPNGEFEKIEHTGLIEWFENQR